MVRTYGIISTNCDGTSCSDCRRICIVSAAIVHLMVSAWMGAQPAPTVGASGAMFGLLLAFGWFFPQRRVMLIFPPIPMPSRVFVAVYGADGVGTGADQRARVDQRALARGVLGVELLARRRLNRRQRRAQSIGLHQFSRESVRSLCQSAQR